MPCSSRRGWRDHDGTVEFRRRLWIDHIVTIGIALSLTLLTWMIIAVPLQLVSGFVVVWLVWQLLNWWKRARDAGDE